MDVVELSGLLAASRQNCEQFPTVLDDGSVVPADPVKLRRALRHSTVVVALYLETRESSSESIGRVPEKLDGGGWLNYWMPQSPMQRTLIAFGRATSDFSLTASIYDLVVSIDSRFEFLERAMLAIYSVDAIMSWRPCCLITWIFLSSVITLFDCSLGLTMNIVLSSVVAFIQYHAVT